METVSQYIYEEGREGCKEERMHENANKAVLLYLEVVLSFTNQSRFCLRFFSSFPMVSCLYCHHQLSLQRVHLLRVYFSKSEGSCLVECSWFWYNYLQYSHKQHEMKAEMLG